MATKVRLLVNACNGQIFLAIASAVFVYQSAFSQENVFDPSGYLNEQEKAKIEKQKESESAADQVSVKSLKERFVYIKGIRYRQITSNIGSVLLPDLTHFSEEDIKRAQCTDAVDPKHTGDAKTETTAIKAFAPLGAEVRIFSQLIVSSIKKRCGKQAQTGTPPPSRIPPKLQIGVEWEGKGRDPKKYKIYNENLQPNVGFGAEF